MKDSLDRRLSRRQVLAGTLLFSASLVGCGTRVQVHSSPEDVDPQAVVAPTIYSVSQWGGRAPTEPVTLVGRRPDKILIHHTESGNTTDFSQSRAFSLARIIQSDHISRGYIDSGQHFTISRGAYVMEGRHRSLETLKLGGNMVSGAHCTGQNDRAIGIENEGSYMTTLPPQAQYDRLVQFCAYICKQYGLAPDRIYGHRDYLNTDCPGDRFYDQLHKLRRDVATQLGTYTLTRTWTVLREGNTGDRVKALQHLLTARGYSLTTDGSFGPGTASAVRSFQTSRGLTADAVVGRNTWEALIVNVQQGDRGTGGGAWAAQTLLKLKGYNITVDGVWGSGSSSALKSFQTSRSLSATGITDPDSWSLLLS